MRKRHQRQRQDLTGEHPAGDTGQIILACLFAVVWSADSFLLHYTTQLNDYIPFGLRLIPGVILLVLSLYLAKSGLATVFGEQGEHRGVIRHGVFRFMRHPIYLSELLLYLGLIAISLSLAALGVWLLACAFLHYISRYEERLLLARFGEEYADYMRAVPMWLPWHRQRMS